jgi:hypothetical protein
LEGNVTPSLHVQETALFHVEGECDPCAVCWEKGTKFILKESVIPLLHVQKMVPFHVECKCDPFGACSENGTV